MLASAALFALIASAQVPHGSPVPPPPAQDLTLPPESADTVTILEGRGVQIYTCTAQAGAYRWLFKAPEAQLFNLATGVPAGHHDAGPRWTLDDGSSVQGTVAASKPGPTPADVPWLLLHTTPSAAPAPAPKGVLSTVTYVRRYNTHGGAAPVAGCDASHLAEELRVPYSADYAFYSVPGAPSNLQQPPPPPPPPPAAPGR